MAIRYLSGIDVDQNTLFVDDVNNRVGIGTATPNVELAVYESGAPRIHLQNSTSGTASNKGFQIALSGVDGYLWNWQNGATLFATNNAERMRITSAGNVGIGTTSPVRKLDVVGTGRFSDDLTISGSKRLFLNGSTGQDWALRTNSSSANFDIVDWTTEQARISVTPAGNVGIGTTAPTSKLHVASGRIEIDNGQSLSSRTSGGGNIFPLIGMSNNAINVGGWEGSFMTDLYLMGGNGAVLADFSQGNSKFFAVRGVSGSTPSEYMRITSAGNVGIGTTAPGAKLDIVSTGAGSEGLRVDGASGGFAFVVKGGTDYTSHIRAGATIGVNYFTTPPSNGLIVEGNVGIGTTSPSTTLTLGNSTDNIAELRVLRSNSISGTYGFINTVGGTAQIGGSGDTRILSVAASAALRLNTNGIDRLSLLGDGQFWIKLLSTTEGREANISNDDDKLRIFGSRYGGTGKYVSIWSDGANENARFYPTNTVFYKNVGIGTTAPTVPLHIVKDNATISMTNTTAFAVDTGSRLFLGGKYSSGTSNNTTPFAWIVGAKENATDGNQAGYLSITTVENGGGFAERMRVTSTGNVGIGTTSPYSLLQVGNPEQTTPAELTIASRYDGGGPRLNFRTDHPNNNNQWNTARIVATDDGNYNGRIEFRTTNSSGHTGVQPTTKMVIKASGNVGIGTTSPTELLHVAGTPRIDSEDLPPAVITAQVTQDKYVGLNSAVLTDPSTWMKVNINGVIYLIPAYLYEPIWNQSEENWSVSEDVWNL